LFTQGQIGSPAVSALMGLDVMKAAYAHAIKAGYRFYSYGEASLLLPSQG
jgi:S-adenosylmethionine:tRNA ribosyltransferase-isomerase